MIFLTNYLKIFYVTNLEEDKNNILPVLEAAENDITLKKTIISEAHKPNYLSAIIVSHFLAEDFEACHTKSEDLFTKNYKIDIFVDYYLSYLFSAFHCFDYDFLQTSFRNLARNMKLKNDEKLVDLIKLIHPILSLKKAISENDKNSKEKYLQKVLELKGISKTKRTIRVLDTFVKSLKMS